MKNLMIKSSEDLKQLAQDVDASDRLAHRKAEIIEVWSERLRHDIPPAQHLSGAALRDSLPKWLSCLERALASPDLTKKFEVIEDKAKEHGRERVNEEFDLNQVLYEYMLLRQVIFDTLERERPMGTRQRDIVLDAIQQSMRVAASEYIELQTKRKRFELLRSTKKGPLIESIRALAIIGVATLLQWAAWPFVQPYAYFLYYPAVVFASLYGSAVVGVVLAAVLGRFLFVPPYFHFYFPEFSSVARWITFVSSAALIAWITNEFRNTRKVTEAAYQEQEKATKEADRLYDASVKSEQEFRAIFELAASGKAILDSETKCFLKVNPTLCKLLGYTEKELLEKTITEITHPDDRNRQLDIDQSSIENHFNAWHAQKRFIKKEKEIIWAVVSAAELSQKEGQAVRTVVTIHDITDLKKTQSDLQEAVKHLEEERGLREQFVTMLSHDLRNPLTSAKMSVDLMKKYPEKTDSIARLGDRAITSLDRADKMIQDLLDANRIQAGQSIPLEIHKTDLAHILIELAEEMAILHGNRFKLESPKCLEGCWNGLALRRIAENLVTNAVKYGDSAEPISIALRRISGQVEILVHNFGKAISGDDQSRLFKIFHRTETAAHSGKRGWGIGLALVRGLTEAMGGQIRVESTEEAGTTFTVTLPLDSTCFQLERSS